MLTDARHELLASLVHRFCIEQGRRTARTAQGTLTVAISDFGNVSVQLHGARAGLLAVGDEFGFYRAFTLRRVGGLWRSAEGAALEQVIDVLQAAITDRQEAA